MANLLTKGRLVKLYRSALFLIAIGISSQASAGLFSYSFDATLNSAPYPVPGIVYPMGSAVHGSFTFDDSKGVIDDPGIRHYPGAFSGSIQVGGNTINFASGISHVFNYPNNHGSRVDMFGGHARDAGGTISETNSPGFAAEGVQIFFEFKNQIAVDTPIDQLLATSTRSAFEIYLDYGYHGMEKGNWGTITNLVRTNPVEVPEPYSILLTGLGLIGAIATRRLRR